MSQLRFGRKIPVPSTAQIKHEMRLMGAADALAAATTPEAFDGILHDVAGTLGLSADGERLFVERFKPASA